MPISIAWLKSPRKICSTKSKRARKIRSRALIYALGILFVGERTGQLLAEHFSSIEDLAAAKAEELEEVPEVGPKVSASIVEFFSEPANRSILKKLYQGGGTPNG